ncbi:MAG: polyprenyl synthetase family protein [Succinivibrionaceae bacterium]|nr:polyprenyl synthetase family protein [Succinivibrionaceae bacterium]
MSALTDSMSAARERVNGFLGRCVEALDRESPSLREAMAHGLLLGGKRVRPFLVYEAGRLMGAAPSLLDRPAAAVECIHAYSLIHDDMPEMDNDTLRRGQPTVHAKFGPAMALLAGDALQSLAYEILLGDEGHLPAAGLGLRAQWAGILSAAAGCRGMCGGQALDLAAEGQSLPQARLELLHSRKTGALIVAAVAMGIAAGATQEGREALLAYARKVGLAFQIWDDVLDVIGDTASLGKTQGKDEAEGKSTYPALLGLDGARAYAQAVRDEALAALADIPGDTSVLMDFARFAVERDH